MGRSGILFVLGMLFSATLGLIVAAFSNIWIGAIVTGVTIVSIAMNGIVRIEAQPPHKGVLTILGRRQKGAPLNEGIHFLPIRPWISDAIPVPVQKINSDFAAEPTQKVTIPDGAQLTIPISITWSPDEDRLIQFLNSGGKDGVVSILGDVVRERLREWAFSPHEGPQTWQEAMGMRFEALAVLAKAIIGSKSQRDGDEDGALTDIESGLPTPLLLRYFHEPFRKPPRWESEKRFAGEQWERFEEMLEREAPGQWDRDALEGRVNSRRREIEALRMGSRKFTRPDLGIAIWRINVGEILLSPELAQAAERKAIEEREKEAEQIEREHYADMIINLRERLGITTEQAIELIQTERGKVTKALSESKWSISPETREMFSEIIPDVLLRILAKKG